MNKSLFGVRVVKGWKGGLSSGRLGLETWGGLSFGSLGEVAAAAASGWDAPFSGVALQDRHVLDFFRRLQLQLAQISLCHNLQ